MNTLLIDAGNTRIKWALAAPEAAPGTWVAQGAVARGDTDGLRAAWWTLGLRPGRALLSNVAGEAAGAAIAGACAAAWPDVTLERFVPGSERAGVRNGYREPGKLGSDRFAAAIGARALFPGQAAVVATCGTATTVDTLHADGLFAGGMILPGLHMMAQALHAGTAQLPPIDWQARSGAGTTADNTLDAIAGGCLAAQCGAIERAVRAAGGALCLLSGGAAPAIAPGLGIAYQIIDNLVLTGLHAASRTQP